MDMNFAALGGAVAASIGVLAHGVVGNRWLAAQLRVSERGPTGPTELSTRLFGPANVAAPIFGVTWHSVTAFFLVAAGALYLTAFGVLESRDMLRFIAVVFAAFLAVGAYYIGPRVSGLRGPIPPLFVTAMTGGAVLAWIASNSV
jgi:hypothetical protein